MNTDDRSTSVDAQGVAVAEDGDGTSASLRSEPTNLDIVRLLTALRKMRDGDFSVRLPNAWTGLEGKVVVCGAGCVSISRG